MTGWYRQLVHRAWLRRRDRRLHMLLIFAERGWSRPHQMGLLLVLLFGGLIGLVLPEGGSLVVAQVFPPPFFYVWYLGTLLGSVVALYGVRRRDAIGLMTERAGLIALTGWLLSFPVVGFATIGSDAASVSLFVGVFGVCNLARAFIISVDLAELETIVNRARRMTQPPDDEA